MDPPPEGSILLTGEGDFSFAFAFLLQADDPTRIIATCYDDEEAIKKHKGADKNIQMIRDLGASVVLGVDATKLHEIQITKPDQHFSCIIFNFPHIGGKSNIKKNKALLKDFFTSAYKVLKDDGKVCVSLCRGQGGTPADNPQREWSNTWQIVSMATYGGLILKEVRPFRVEDYPQYASTGFRSRDQWFHTNDALTHVFIKSLPNSKHQMGTKVTFPGMTGSYLCHSFVARKLKLLGQTSDCKSLYLNEKHPTAATLKTVLREVCNIFDSAPLRLPIVRPALIKLDFPFLRLDVSKYYVAYEEQSPDGYPLENSCCATDLEKTESGGFCAADTSDTPENLGLKKHSTVDTVLESEKCPKSIKLTGGLGSSHDNNSALPVSILRQLKSLGVMAVDSSRVRLLPSSLVEHFLSDYSNDFEVSDNGTYCFTGIVFERCPVVENRYPARRELLVVKKIENDQSFDEFCSQSLKCIPETVRNRLRVVHKKEADFDSIVSSAGFVFQSSHCKTRTVIGLDFHVDQTDLKAYEPCSSTDAKIFDDEASFSPLGYVGLFSPHPEDNAEKPSFSYLVLDLDKLTKEIHNVSDLRLLWSEDDRIFSETPHTNLEFLNTDNDNQCDCSNKDDRNSVIDLKRKFDQSATSTPINSIKNDLPKTVPISRFPIKHRHDVTFWENCQDDFDEQLFLDNVRDIADDNVKSVTLVNEFDHSDYGHSRCYRLIYQSCDRALSYHMSHDLQNTNRLNVESVQGVTLR